MGGEFGGTAHGDLPGDGQALPPFDPADPTQAGQVGGTSYDGTSYYNSGLFATGDPAPPY